MYIYYKYMLYLLLFFSLNITSQTNILKILNEYHFYDTIIYGHIIKLLKLSCFSSQIRWGFFLVIINNAAIVICVHSLNHISNIYAYKQSNGKK